jgi:hypothetical protein
MDLKQLNRQFLLLFTRLTWPTPIVRERTCSAIAELLLDQQYSVPVKNYLLNWMANQKLESVATSGLLILLRAKTKDQKFNLPNLEEILGNFSAHSLLLTFR